MKLLGRKGTEFDRLPAWQRNGVGLLWETYEKSGRDLRTGVQTRTTRRRIVVEMDLPAGDAYGAFIMGLLSGTTAGGLAK